MRTEIAKGTKAAVLCVGEEETPPESVKHVQNMVGFIFSEESAALRCISTDDPQLKATKQEKTGTLCAHVDRSSLIND